MLVEQPEIAAASSSDNMVDLARKIIELTGSRSEIQYLPERAGDVKHSQAAVDRLTATGFRPTGDFDGGLAETIRYFAER